MLHTLQHEIEAMGDGEVEEGSVALTNTSSSTSSQTLSDGSTDVTFLEYPPSFFDITTGQGPKSPTEAVNWWPCRMKRPRKGVMDQENPNGTAMMKEVKEIQESLVAFTQSCYLEEAKNQAHRLKMTLPNTSSLPSTKSDLISAASFCSSSKERDEAASVLFERFYAFHRNRGWLATVVDKWCAQRKMKILRPMAAGESTTRARTHLNARGGFTVVARNARSTAIRSVMNPLLSKTGWCVSAVKKKSKSKSFEKANIKLSNGTQMTCYIVRKVRRCGVTFLSKSNL